MGYIVIEYDMVPTCPSNTTPPRASASFTLGMDGWMSDCFEWMHFSTRRTRVDGADARVEAFSVFSGCSSRVRETERLANAIDREIARAR